MLSQSINTEIIKWPWPDIITQNTYSKTFALLLIEDHEINNSFSGIDTEGGGGGGRYGFCHRRHAVMIFFLFKRTGQVSNTS